MRLPLMKFEEACRIVALKQADLRKRELVVQRLELHAAVYGKAYDASLASEAKQAYESNKMIIGNIQQEIDYFEALRPPVPKKKHAMLPALRRRSLCSMDSSEIRGIVLNKI